MLGRLRTAYFGPFRMTVALMPELYEEARGGKGDAA
jgi:hypothetical protein